MSCSSSVRTCGCFEQCNGAWLFAAQRVSMDTCMPCLLRVSRLTPPYLRYFLQAHQVAMSLDRGVVQTNKPSMGVVWIFSGMLPIKMNSIVFFWINVQKFLSTFSRLIT